MMDDGQSMIVRVLNLHQAVEAWRGVCGEMSMYFPCNYYVFIMYYSCITHVFLMYSA